MTTAHAMNLPNLSQVAQIFFSIGITFGIMTAYGSHCHRDEPAFMNSCVIAASNSLYSFIAGFVVFGKNLCNTTSEIQVHFLGCI